MPTASSSLPGPGWAWIQVLPDFRGAEGFWRAYPALQHHGLSFEDMANPASFSNDPTLAWGFYGHRLALYRQTEPHSGFDILRRWGDLMEYGAFAFTSNVDGQFQKAGFPPEHVAECRGTIHALQCMAPCVNAAWTAQGFEPDMNETTGRLINDMPTMRKVGATQYIDVRRLRLGRQVFRPAN